VDDALVNALYTEYLPVSGMPRSSAITNNMLYYYAFAGSNASHTVSPTTPAAIVEMGYLTNPSDLAFINNKPDVVAGAIAAGIERFLNGR
jgi:N-acetylmuramoyl-L-alanine amidase